MKLLDAEHSAQAHTNVLEVVKKELDHIKLVKTMSTNPMNLTEHYKAAKWVWELHNESQQWLQDLTADISLSGFSLSPDPSPTDKEYIKKYILAWFQKHGILIHLTKYQDKVNPIRSSKHCGGRLVVKVGK